MRAWYVLAGWMGGCTGGFGESSPALAPDAAVDESVDEPGAEVAPARTACAVPSTEPAAGRVLLEMPIKLVLGGKPLALGAAGKSEAGVEYKISQLKFYLADPVLIDGAGARTPAAVIESSGHPAPYGLVLVDADKPASQVLRVRAAPGRYAALEIGVGVPNVCNHSDPTKQVFPLNTDGGMYWTWITGFMFVRLQGEVYSDRWELFLVHHGYDALYRTATLSASLALEEDAPGGPTIVFDVGRLLAGHSMDGGPHLAATAAIASNIANNGVLSFEP